MSARQRKRREARRREHSVRRTLVAAGGLTAGATLAMSGVAHAAPMTFTVGSLGDGTGALDCANPANTTCTLRQAIIDANNNAGADTIVFRSGLTGSISLTADPPTVLEAVAIQGPGASQITVDGGTNYRGFHVDPSTALDPVSISGLTVSDGAAGGVNGGGIYNRDAALALSNVVVSGTIPSANVGGGVATGGGSLTIDHSTVSGNTALLGGGIGSLFGDVTVTDSTVKGNTSTQYGGGIWTLAADLTVRGSTISGNDASEDGGGIYSSYNSVAGGNAVTLERSTVSGNHAVNDDGGGVWVCCGDPGDALTVVGSTITGNTAATIGGGLQAYLGAQDPVVQDSIVSGNTANPASTSDVHEGYAGYFFNTAFSLIGVPSGYVNTTVPGSNLFGIDPQLGALANNGGPTETQLPANTSPVIDKGSSFGFTTDQRGLTRPIEISSIPNSTAAGADGADMGAVEVQSVPTQAPAQPAKKKKCKKKKHKRSAESAKKKKCKKKKKK